MSTSDQVEEDLLPEHTLSMRRAAAVCRDLWSKIESIDARLSLMGKREGNYDIESYREISLAGFQQELKRTGTISIVEGIIDAAEFRAKFQRANIPCLIRGRPEFHNLSSKWTIHSHLVRRQWFLDNLGDTTMVPIRQQTASGVVDDEGRAEECSTVMLPIKQWAESTMDDPKNYLKDWHLQQEIQLRTGETLYQVPDIFQHDILNDFLTTFTPGDYRFTYWGPPHSRTLLHSDVLNSFSWSHNVLGEKKWTFYPPECPAVVVHQRAGETMFVPSGWQHEVDNLVETLSVNHNWITAANVDLAWRCVFAEWKAVEKECNEWNITDFAARESMLRGCIGLDITSFFLMTLFSILKLIKNDTQELQGHHHIELELLIQTLANVYSTASIGLRLRLSAVLDNDELALDLMSITQDIHSYTRSIPSC